MDQGRATRVASPGTIGQAAREQAVLLGHTRSPHGTGGAPLQSAADRAKRGRMRRWRKLSDSARVAHLYGCQRGTRPSPFVGFSSLPDRRRSTASQPQWSGLPDAASSDFGAVQDEWYRTGRVVPLIQPIRKDGSRTRYARSVAWNDRAGCQGTSGPPGAHAVPTRNRRRSPSISSGPREAREDAALAQTIGLSAGGAPVRLSARHEAVPFCWIQLAA